MSRRKKIVFILGAGFSNPAGVPTQKKLLAEILKHAKNPEIKNFLITLYRHSKDIPMEDIFTALDKAILGNEILYRFGTETIFKIKKDLLNQIIEILKEKSVKPRNKYIRDFAEKIINKRLPKASSDPLAIISTNWDSLLDNVLESTILNKYTTDINARNIYIDYCTYTQSLTDKHKVPSNLIKAKGLYNIKLLKLHGSVNWFCCPSCNSLFTEFETDPKLPFDTLKYCEICKKNLNIRNPLKPLLISPTFIKDINNVHLKHIWWNAGFELVEATHIVFIGYSLPLSDFELRYLFARSIKKAKIKVILFSADPKSPDENARATKQRYLDFFGKALKRSDINYEGVESYIKKLKSGAEVFYW